MNRRIKSILLVTHNLLQAQKFQEDLSNFIPEDELYIFPANELIAADLSVASPELRAQRVEALNFWSQGKKGIVIVPIPGVRKFFRRKMFGRSYQFSFKLGEDLELEPHYIDSLRWGITELDMVSSPGEFSIRGRNHRFISDYGTRSDSD